MKNELNTILRIFIYLVILRHVINIPQQLIKVTTGIYDNAICLFTVGMSIAIIIILYYILKAKKWALVSFFILQYINAVTIGTIEGKGDYLTHIIVSTILCGILSALLFLKKGGASGWIMFLGREDKGNVINNDETPCDINPINDSGSLPEGAITDNTEKNILNNPTKDMKVVDNETQPNNTETIIASIPKKEDGSINYEAMDIYQQFEYTSVTESKNVAIKDLVKEILIRKKEVKKLNHKLSSMTGGKRAEQRDIIREKENEIQKLESLLPDCYKKQKSRRKNVIVSLCTIIIIAIAVTSAIIGKNYIDDQNIRLYRVSVFNLVSENEYIAPYDEFIDILDRPLRKYRIYSNLKYKHKVNLPSSYKEFAIKLGYKNSNLAQEFYDALKEKGVNIDKKTSLDKFPIWLKEDGNFNAVFQIFQRKTNISLTGFEDELGIEPITITDNSDFIEKVLRQEIKINQIIDKDDEIRKDNISILYKAVFEGRELSSNFSEKGFREWILEDKSNAVNIYNILLDNGVDIFGKSNNSKSKFIDWLYEQP